MGGDRSRRDRCSRRGSVEERLGHSFVLGHGELERVAGEAGVEISVNGAAHPLDDDEVRARGCCISELHRDATHEYIISIKRDYFSDCRLALFNHLFSCGGNFLGGNKQNTRSMEANREILAWEKSTPRSSRQ